MEFQRRLILILFVDEELAFSLFMAMYLEHQAAGLFASLRGQSPEDSFRIRFLTWFRFPNHRENDHLCAGWANIASARRFISSGVTSSICCAIDHRYPYGSARCP